jgi:hydrogenase large subunit
MRKEKEVAERDLFIEPMTRIEGHLAIHAKVDMKAKKFIDAHSYATMFRGFEIILKNRELADAIWITQRICGVCPAPHASASIEAVDMAYQAPPPPLGIVLRNLVLESEELYDPPIGCALLEGPDYSKPIVKKYNLD